MSNMPVQGATIVRKDIAIVIDSQTTLIGCLSSWMRIYFFYDITSQRVSEILITLIATSLQRTIQKKWNIGQRLPDFGIY